MLASLHPFPVNLLVFTVFTAAIVPPIVYVLAVHRHRWRNRIVVAVIFVHVLLMILAAYDLYQGWLWRHDDSYSSKSFRELPWYYTPHWKWIARVAMIVFGCSCLGTILVGVPWSIVRRR